MVTLPLSDRMPLTLIFSRTWSGLAASHAGPGIATAFSANATVGADSSAMRAPAAATLR